MDEWGRRLAQLFSYFVIAVVIIGLVAIAGGAIYWSFTNLYEPPEQVEADKSDYSNQP